MFVSMPVWPRRSPVFFVGDFFGFNANPWLSVSFLVMLASGLLLCYGLPLVGILLALPRVPRDDP